MTTKPNVLQRFQWSLLNRRGHDAVGRIDVLARWLDYQNLETWRRDASAVAQYGAPGAGDQARGLVADMQDELTVLQTGLARGYELAAGERWDQLRIDLDHLEQRQQRYENARTRLMELTQAHLQAQQEVLQDLGECDTCVRAEVLAEELDKAPDLDGLAKPDLTAYRDALARVHMIIPDDAQGRVAFNPEQARAAVAEVRLRAAEAEQTANGYFYEALRGYEATLGEAETKRLSELMKDPMAMRRLRRDHPELLERQAAYGTGDMMPMLLMFWLLSSHSSGWGMAPSTAEAAGVEDVPMHDWLQSYDVPQAADFAAEWDAADSFDSGSDWGGGGGDAGGFDSGGGDFGGGGDSGGGGGGD